MGNNNASSCIVVILMFRSQGKPQKRRSYFWIHAEESMETINKIPVRFMLQAMLEKLQLPCLSIYLSQRRCSRPEDIHLLCCLLYIAITWRPIFFDVTRNKGSKKKSRAFNTCSSPRWLIICSFSPSEGRARRYGAKFPVGKVRSPITTLVSEVIFPYYRGVWLL